jgi:hypothetical protein
VVGEFHGKGGMQTYQKTTMGWTCTMTPFDWKPKNSPESSVHLQMTNRETQVYVGEGRKKKIHSTTVSIQDVENAK